ncbi:PBP1A family penicillin-binding protein [Helicobacter cholecystus]|uniref:PBP1A family penicillin-binding protein n=1 Tax=Helicobacter cholecystus TaxID=45498 RepID=A0A3D8IWK1_9HELI|nr:PBP1A family penicillin-binding protein [Helicobacter cholecystus]RDU69622.1 PBP1A family penicillin-binding protein [Helicobacter cholecystus]VEJ24181.1 multimodular transpeptidase-transglycosylase [Helicobacter cholecystus]
MFIKIRKIFLISLVIFTLIICAYIIRIFFTLSESLEKITHYQPELATQIFDRKGRLIANVFDKELRFYVKFDEIPPRMIEALLAVEDTLFFEHNGINFDAISRAMIKNIIARKYLEGGSTLTQQLVKNIALTRDKTLDRKLKEAILSYQVERNLSKEEILERYFNETFFGHGYYGIKAAAQGYFKKSLEALSLKEIAMLVGLPRAPSFYDPTRNYEFSLSRANNILERMKVLGWISQEEYLASIAQAPEVYSQSLTQNKAPYVVDEVLRQLSYIPNLKSKGYRIYLNIDLDYQEIAQEAVIYGYNRVLERIQSRQKNKSQEKIQDQTLNGAMVVTESKSGKILALIGGVDHSKSSFNRATQSKRQFGSSIKPFIYQIAFDNGYSPASQVPDVARSYSKSFDRQSTQIREQQDVENMEEPEYWRPKNFTSSFNGVVTLKTALIKSLNLATINLVEMIGFEKIYSDFEKFGFEDIPKDMSIVLGSLSLSPLSAAEEFSIFSNQGTLVHPYLVNQIIDTQGNITYFQTQEELITSKDQAFLMTSILQEAINKGTGRQAKVKGITLAGKTGTSNENIDAWFCGYSPSLQVIIWYGRDDNTPIGKYESGGVVASAPFAYFFKQVLKIDPGLKRNFEIPSGIKKKNIKGENYYYTDISNPSNSNKLENIQQKPIF